MPEKKRILITLPLDLVEKLERYAEEEHMGNRTQAVYYILKHFIENLEAK